MIKESRKISAMPRKTKEEVIEFFKTEKGKHKIYMTKTGLENATIKTFPQLFAVISKSNIRSLLGSEFYAFDKTIEDAGRFTFTEVDTLADFFKVDFEVMARFIRKNQLISKKKNKKN